MKLFYALLTPLLLCACSKEYSPPLPICKNVTVIERTEDRIRFTIDSTEPSVEIYNPDIDYRITITERFYNCLSLSITSVLIMDGSCIIE